MSDEQPLSSDQDRRVKARLKKIKAYQDVFNSPLGSKVLHDMMRAHGLLSAHPVNPQEMALKEGERLVVLRILSFLKINPQELIERIGDDETV